MSVGTFQSHRRNKSLPFLSFLGKLHLKVLAVIVITKRRERLTQLHPCIAEMVRSLQLTFLDNNLIPEHAVSVIVLLDRCTSEWDEASTYIGTLRFRIQHLVLLSSPIMSVF